MAGSKIIFVTGASGFLGSHIVSQLLENNYTVRAAIRQTKVQQIKERYASYGDRFQVVPITDISTDELQASLKGVYAVIHSAAALAGRENPAELIRIAIEGNLNVVRQAEQAGVKRVIVTSSIATVTNPNGTFKDTDWNPITKEEALNASDEFDVYRGAKALSEKELWAFADSHPNIDVTTLNPPFLYGPFTKEFNLPTPDYGAMSTNLYIYRLLARDGPYPGSPLYSDVRDVATAHVRALTSPLSTETGIGRKRIVMGSVYPNDFEGVKALLNEKRPELKDRLTQEQPPVYRLKRLPFDVARLEQILGLKKEDHKTFEDTILAAVDSILERESEWISKGLTIKIPNNKD